MLSKPERRPGPPQQRSLRQEYAEFLEQRIEEYKEQLSREDLLAVADEAVRELEIASDEQLVLTEVLVLEHVDRLIMRRLDLPTFRKWRHRHVKLRQAQRDPEYWDMRPEDPVVSFGTQTDEMDVALVLGEAAVPNALFLAAYDWQVVFVDPTLGAVEAAEKLAATEGLGSRLQALVVNLGQWFPEMTPSLVVLDPKLLSEIEAAERVRLLDELKQMTTSRGVHCHLPGKAFDGSLAPAVIRAHYGDWIAHQGTAAPDDWFLATKP